MKEPRKIKIEELEKLYPNRISQPKSVCEIPLPPKYLVYILANEGCPIVVGHGRKGRAKVIFDSESDITFSHIKSTIVRLYILFRGDSKFSRFLIQCDSKTDAKNIETNIQKKFGGNTLNVPDDIQNRLFQGLEEHTPNWMVLKMALCSSFGGLSDLKKWRRSGILDDEVWKDVQERLKLK